MSTALAVTPLSEFSRFDAYETNQQQWLEDITAKWPGRWKQDAQREHSRRRAALGDQAANLWLLDLAGKIKACRIAPNATDDDILTIAEKQAKRARDRACRWASSGTARVRQQTGKLCTEWGFEPPAEKHDDAAALARMTDALWWRRKLRTESNRERENIAIALGRVHAKHDIYLSQESHEAEQHKQRRNALILESTEAISEDGEIFTLAELAEHSLSNPTLRRNELMVRVKGFEDVARDRGHVGIFVTLTCPSRMHARIEKTGRMNSSYDGTSPKQAQAYLCNLWADIRSNLKNHFIDIYGLRIAEPNHDGTPHWHMLLFCSPLHVDVLKNTIRRYALIDSPDEPGAQQYRVEFVDIDPAKGSAAGYIAKYIGKNVDGSGIDLDENGLPAEESISRVTAWARLHGIHQFDFIGGPPAGLWRELRRIPESVIDDAPKIIGAAWRAAQKTEDRQADFAGLIRAVGGPLVKRSDQAIQLAKKTSQRPGRYGFEVVTKPVGIYQRDKPGNIYESERKDWQIRMRTGEFGRNFIGDPFAKYRPWTRVNNCAGLDLQGFPGDDRSQGGGNVILFPRPGSTGPPRLPAGVDSGGVRT